MATRKLPDKDSNLATALCSSEYKVIVIGGLGVGKTSMLLRYVHDTFEDRVSRFVAEEKKSIIVGGCEIVLDIWDTAGQERYQSITNRFYNDSHAVIIVYDVTGEETVRDLSFWVREVTYYLVRELENGMPVMFVGNKKDLLATDAQSNMEDDDGLCGTGGVTLRQVQDLSSVNGFLRPVEISAKTGENVQKVFHLIAAELVKRNHIKPHIRQPNLTSSSDNSCSC